VEAMREQCELDVQYIWDLGFGNWGLGFGVWDSGFMGEGVGGRGGTFDGKSLCLSVCWLVRVIVSNSILFSNPGLAHTRTHASTLSLSLSLSLSLRSVSPRCESSSLGEEVCRCMRREVERGG
jgi:hypothetical protein